jgi:hypothetical protein
LVESIVLAIVLRQSAVASSRVISSLYSCLRRDAADEWLAPIHVAFQPE